MVIFLSGWACKSSQEKTSDFLTQMKGPFSMQKVAQQNPKPKGNLTSLDASAKSAFLVALRASYELEAAVSQK